MFLFIVYMSLGIALEEYDGKFRLFYCICYDQFTYSNIFDYFHQLITNFDYVVKFTSSILLLYLAFGAFCYGGQLLRDMVSIVNVSSDPLITWTRIPSNINQVAVYI